MSGERKVWVVTLDRGVLLEPGSQVLVEQFGDAPPTIAFREDSGAVWGPPFDSEAR